METEAFLVLATRLEYLTEDQVTPSLALLAEAERMLAILRRRLLE